MTDPFDRAYALVKERRPDLADEFSQLQTMALHEVAHWLDCNFPLRSGKWGVQLPVNLYHDLRAQLDGEL